MTYGKLGQQKPGHLSSKSVMSKKPGGTVPRQTERGYGGAKSSRAAVPGRPNGEGQKQRGYPRNEKAAKRPTRNTSAGRIKKGRA